MLLLQCLALAGRLGQRIAHFLQALVAVLQLLLHFVQPARQVLRLRLGHLQGLVHGLLLRPHGRLAPRHLLLLLLQLGLRGLRRFLARLQRGAGGLHGGFLGSVPKLLRQALNGIGHGRGQQLALPCRHAQALAQGGKPGLQHRADGIWRASADLLAHALDGRPQALGDQGVCRGPDIGFLHAAGGCFLHIVNYFPDYQR